MELEKVCGEMALGYFKVLLKKREAEVINRDLLYKNK